METSSPTLIQLQQPNIQAKVVELQKQLLFSHSCSLEHKTHTCVAYLQNKEGETYVVSTGQASSSSVHTYSEGEGKKHAKIDAIINSTKVLYSLVIGVAFFAKDANAVESLDTNLLVNPENKND